MKMPLFAALLVPLAAVAPAHAADHLDAPALNPIIVISPAPTSAGQATRPVKTVPTEMIQMTLSGD